jgi:hypothetical protein
MLYLKAVVALGVAVYVGISVYGLIRHLLDLAFPP